jgi:hypothetical protein
MISAFDRTASGLLIWRGTLTEYVRCHSVVVSGQVSTLLCESTGAGKLARARREEVFLLENNIGSGNDVLVGIPDPEVEGLTGRETVLSQGGMTDESDEQAQPIARDHLHNQLPENRLFEHENERMRREAGTSCAEWGLILRSWEGRDQSQAMRPTIREWRSSTPPAAWPPMLAAIVLVMIMSSRSV